MTFETTGFPMDDGDYDGIRTLLKQLFTEKSCVNISTVSEELIRQNTIGSVLKHSNDVSVLIILQYNICTNRNCYHSTQVQVFTFNNFIRRSSIKKF